MRSNPVLHQEPLTTWVVDVLTQSLLVEATLVGDGVAPLDGGWEDGQPGVGEFVPYITVAGGTAVAGRETTMGTDYADWRVTYELRATAASRRQVDATGDQAVDILAARRGTRVRLEDADWKIVDVRMPVLGSPSRNDTTDPPYWEAADTVELWLSRSSS